MIFKCENCGYSITIAHWSYQSKHVSEAATRIVLWKKLFLKISQ